MPPTTRSTNKSPSEANVNVTPVIPNKPLTPKSKSKSRIKDEYPKSEDFSLVWVKSENKGDPYQWWPAKVTDRDKISITVERFGDIEPKYSTIKTPTRNLLSFRDRNFAKFRAQMEPSPTRHTAAFRAATEQAFMAEMEENDGLPSTEYLDDEIRNSPIKPVKLKRKAIEKSDAISKIKKSKSFSSDSDDAAIEDPFTVGGIDEVSVDFTSSESDQDPFDTNLNIPGEKVLALADKKYWPAQLMEFKPPNRYKVKYFDGACRLLKREQFFAVWDYQFCECKLGEISQTNSFKDIEDIDEKIGNTDDPELRERVLLLKPRLIDILLGKDDQSWRLSSFKEGGKRRRELTQRVALGPFTAAEYQFIWRLLEEIFVPETKRPRTFDSDLVPEPRAGNWSLSQEIQTLSEDTLANEFGEYFAPLSAQLKRKIVSDVLLPEAIVALIMQKQELSREDAEERMMEGMDDEGAESLIAAVDGMRRALLNGRSSRDTRREFLDDD